MEQDRVAERAPKPPLPIVTIGLAVANIGAFVLSLAAGVDPGAPSADQIFALGGNFGPATLDGESWRLVSSMFLHYGVLHIAMNMLGLIDGGRHVERLYGRAPFAALYLFAGLAGGLVSALPGKAVSAGASGAIFGIFGAWAAYLLRHRNTIDREALASQSRGLLIFLAYSVYFGMTSETIDMRAHVGGLAAGFVAGLVLAGETYRARRLIAVVVGSALVIGAAHLAPKPQQRIFLASDRTRLEEFARLEKQALDRYNEVASNEKLSEEEIANVIEREILPVWRAAAAQAAATEHVPDPIASNLRGYLEIRERALVTMVDALRKKDEAGLAAAMKGMSESEAYVEKLKGP